MDQPIGTDGDVIVIADFHFAAAMMMTFNK